MYNYVLHSEINQTCGEFQWLRWDTINQNQIDVGNILIKSQVYDLRKPNAESGFHKIAPTSPLMDSVTYVKKYFAAPI